MKKRLYIVLFSFMIVISMTQKSYSLEENHLERWERIAFSALEEKFKGALLEDYQYIGRTEVNGEQTKDVFRVTVNQKGKAFSAHAEVYFHPITNTIISVNVFTL
ncbi:DUF3889 domain-containing protein [Bacillus sp. CLL-3-40]|nr:DUF3889 domain-containing protein [Bacillus changyiensis]MDA1476085.1 DUF3889 domain-containing protein [Bacillus changyiensis]